MTNWVPIEKETPDNDRLVLAYALIATVSPSWSHRVYLARFQRIGAEERQWYMAYSTEPLPRVSCWAEITLPEKKSKNDRLVNDP